MNCALILKVCASVLGGALLLTACGGGGDGADPNAGPQLPAAVTANIVAAAGGSVDVDLADGATSTFVFPAQAFAADQSVTITPLAPLAGEWTRFSIVPGVSRMRAPLTLRVRPPASVPASDIPVLQLVTADGPLLLRTTVLADGRLEAVVPPLLLVPDAAAAGRERPTARERRLADGDEGTTVAGTGFVAFCQVPQATVADARRVILNASRASQVNTALATLAMLHERCAAGADGALDAFAAEIPGLHARALSDWQAANYIQVEEQLDTFQRGVRRVLALCAAARQLGSALACPVAADFEGQFAEIADGFAAAAGERENSGSLRILFDQLLPLPGEAALLGLPQAAPALSNTLEVIADRLMDRAYELCNAAELFEWRIYVENGGPSRRSGETLRRAMGYCGLELSVSFDDSPDSANFLPGSLDGVGRVTQRTLTGPFDEQPTPEFAGGPTRCSRVVGAPVGTEPLILRVGTTTMFELRPTQGDEIRYGLLSLQIPRFLERLGRPADSTDPIQIDFYRGAVSLSGCFDSRGDPLTISAPELLLYSLTVRPPRPLDVSLTMPATLSGATTITVQARDPATDTPAAGAAVSFNVSGGSVSSGGVTNAEGQLSATLTPVFGVAGVTVTADVRATNGTRGSATATSIVTGGAVSHDSRGEVSVARLDGIPPLCPERIVSPIGATAWTEVLTCTTTNSTGRATVSFTESVANGDLAQVAASGTASVSRGILLNAAGRYELSLSVQQPMQATVQAQLTSDSPARCPGSRVRFGGDWGSALPSIQDVGALTQTILLAPGNYSVDVIADCVAELSDPVGATRSASFSFNLSLTKP